MPKNDTILRSLTFACLLGICFNACGVSLDVSDTRANDDSKLLVVKGYTVFLSQEEAKEWYASFRKNLSLGLGMDTGDVVGFDDARYTALGAMVAKLWPHFQKSNPGYIGNVPAPLILLLNNQTPNAFATYDRIKKLHPNVFFVLTGLLQEDENKNIRNSEAVFGVIAHELAHHVLRHGVPGVSDSVDTYYFAENGVEALGRFQRNDNVMKAIAASWIEAAKLIGPFSIPELRGSPVPNFGYPLLFTLEKHLATEHADRPSCAKMNEAAASSLDVIVKGLDLATQELKIIDHEALKKLDDARRDYNEHLVGCVQGDKRSVLNALSTLFSFSELTAFNGSYFSSAERNLLTLEGDLGSSLVKVAESMSDKILSLNTKVDLSRLRNYNIEEQADDAAIEVFLGMGETAKPSIEFFKSAIPPSQITSCLEAIAAGKVPAYGVLSDNHHSTCYRIYHAQQMEAYLKGHETEKNKQMVQN